MIATPGGEAVRLATSDDLDQYLAGAPISRSAVNRAAAEDEAFFLGLRLNRGIDLRQITAEFGADAITKREQQIQELSDAGLLQREGSTLRLTDRGRLLSNEVFERLTLAEAPVEEQSPSAPGSKLIPIRGQSRSDGMQ